MPKQIYMDYAAATPLDPKVLKAMMPYLTKKFYNPSATYLAGRSVRNDVEDARSKVAVYLGARPGEIIFTAGATEANNLAIAGILKNYKDGEVLVSAVEHESVLEPAKQFSHKLVPVNKSGIVDLAKLEKLITAKTVLISVMLVNNELGAVEPIKDIASLVNKVRKQRLSTGSRLPIYLHTDAAQAPNYIKLNVARMGVDLLTLNGGKIYGPKQSGALYVKAGVKLAPLIVGGGQEQNLRSGTQNVAACIGLAKALELTELMREAQVQRITRLRQYFIIQLAKALPSATVNGGKHVAPHILSVTLPKRDNERLMMELDEHGVICATGSACSASSDEPSHVLRAIGLDDAAARSTLRFSFGRITKKSDIQKTVRLLRKIGA